MAQHGKKYLAALEKIDRTRLYEPGEEIGIIKETASAKFDETIELHIRTGLDTRHAEQQLRGTITLPNSVKRCCASPWRRTHARLPIDSRAS
jgi:large subunit ribosomal protein L1